MIEGKGLGNKKINRVNISLTNKTKIKLNGLATACNTRPTTLAAMLVELSLNDPQLVNKLQEQYNVHGNYRIFPVHRNGEIYYV